MSYKILWLADSHECETCGGVCAEGYRIYYDGDLVLDKTPVASCIGGKGYGYDQAYRDILTLHRIHVQEEWVEEE